MYADRELSYRYSGVTKQANMYSRDLFDLQKRIAIETGDYFNACLLNRYDDGSQSVGWHSDSERDIVENSTIASISLGAPRRFLFRSKKTNEKVELLLGHGSLLLMKGEVQKHWNHSLPKMMKVKDKRINLTFRNIDAP